MRVTISSDSVTKAKSDLLALGVGAGQVAKNKLVTALDKAMDGTLKRAAKDEGFTGALGQLLKVPATGIGSGWVALVGLGDNPVHPNRTVAHDAVNAACLQKSVAIVLTEDGEEQTRSAALGALLGGYRYDAYLTGDRKPKGSVKSVSLLVNKKSAALSGAAEEGVILGEATNLARDLVNAPPNDMHPTALANAAKRASRDAGIKCTVWDKKRIGAAKMDLFLAVNRGSAQEPRLIHMVHKPKNAVAKVVFVGKGLTFDSGGLCIKPAKSMVDMKCDMAGAATTIGIVAAAGRLNIPIEVHGIIGSTENMTGAEAYRPGDVFTAKNGKTVEIINTDAEGRLVLADVLTFASELKPDYMIDHATLTGACMVALGKWRGALYANDAELGELYADAAKAAGENYWQMPLDEDLRPGLDSHIADLRHTGPDSYGGSTRAALFLREFIGDTKWAHCDIAGPAFLDGPQGVHPKGGTGFGVATGVRFLESLAYE